MTKKHMNAKNIFLIVVLIVGCGVRSSESLEDRRVDLSMDGEAILQRANQYYKNEKYEMALKYYDALIDQKGLESGEIYFKRGYCNALLLNYNESCQDYIRAADYDFHRADAYYNIGVNLTFALNDSLAIHYFQKSLELNPEDSVVYREMEMAKSRLEEVEKVFRQFRDQ